MVDSVEKEMSELRSTLDSIKEKLADIQPRLCDNCDYLSVQGGYGTNETFAVCRKANSVITIEMVPKGKDLRRVLTPSWCPLLHKDQS